MGFFGGYVFDGSTWHGFDPDSDQGPGVAAPWLSVYIHDSDYAAIRYEPHGTGSGTAYLGCTPRTYFDDESASEPCDVLREAEGLALWLTRKHDRNDTAEIRELIASFLVGDSREQPPGVSAGHEEDAADLDDADTFVEVKVSGFLTAAGLPVPPGLPSP